MTSERKIAAARANGAKSRGPRTEAGKCRSSQNSRKHGLYTRIPPDTSDLPEELLQSFAARWALFQPKTPRAVAALEASIAAELQLFRLQRTETAMMNAECIRLRALYPGLDQNVIYYLASACIPTRLFQRRFSRYCRQMDRADQILFREIGIRKQRTNTAPPAIPEKNAKTSERTNPIPRAPRHAHRNAPKMTKMNERTNRTHPARPVLKVGRTVLPSARASSARLHTPILASKIILRARRSFDSWFFGFCSFRVFWYRPGLRSLGRWIFQN